MNTPRRGLILFIASALLIGSVGSAQGATTVGKTSEVTSGATALPDRLVAVSADGTRATALWTIDNGSARLVQARSATVTSGQLAWGQTTDIGTLNYPATEFRSATPELLLSDDGKTAVAIWMQRELSAGYVVQVSTAAIDGASATWSKPTDLSLAQEWALGGTGALSADGKRLTVAWYVGSDGSNKSNLMSRSAEISNGVATWGDVVMIAGNTQNSGRVMQVKTSADGTKATVVWMRYDFTTVTLQTASAVLEGNKMVWGPFTNLKTPVIELAINIGTVGRPYLNLSRDGKSATVLWQYIYMREGKDTVIAASGAIDGTKASWGETVTLVNNSVPAESASKLGLTTAYMVGSSDGSKALATWRRLDGATWKIEYSVATISGSTASWSAPTGLNIPISTESNTAIRVIGTPDLSQLRIPVTSGVDTKKQVRLYPANLSGSAVSVGDAMGVTAADLNVGQSTLALAADGKTGVVIWPLVGEKTSMLASTLSESVPVVTPPIKPATKKTIVCVKGKAKKKVTAAKPVCPKGWKKKK